MYMLCSTRPSLCSRSCYHGDLPTSAVKSCHRFAPTRQHLCHLQPPSLQLQLLLLHRQLLMSALFGHFRYLRYTHIEAGLQLINDIGD